MGDGNHVVDFGKNFLRVDSERWTALQAIHGAVHSATIAVKYTWFGPGYISNMYFKMITNRPRYKNDHGGDLSFDADTGPYIYDKLQGEKKRQTFW